MNKNKNMADGFNIILVGCGKIGETLVEQLTKEGHDITAIDLKEQKIQSLSNAYDIMGLTGNGASYSVQIEAGVDKADLFIAVTGSDELNLLCCTMARMVSNGKCDTIARIISPDYSDEANHLRDMLGLKMIINPDLEAAKEMASILLLPSALEVNSFAHGRADLIKMKLSDKSILNGMTIASIGQTTSNDLLICIVERNGEIFIPDGNFVLNAGDIVSFVSSRKALRQAFKKLGIKSRQVSDIIIVGGGKTTVYLTRMLLASNVDVKIIEQDTKHSYELSNQLPMATVINADGTDQELLIEEGIESCESFLPLTGIDEENVMLSLYARKNSNAKVITKINRNTFKGVINDLDLDSVIYPRYITCESIIAYVRAKRASMHSSNIERLYHMNDNKVEAIEFKVELQSDVTGIKLMDLNLKKNILIACIYRKHNIIIPNGNDTIEIGDRVVIVTTNTGYSEITDIIE